MKSFRLPVATMPVAFLSVLAGSCAVTPLEHGVHCDKRVAFVGAQRVVDFTFGSGGQFACAIDGEGGVRVKRANGWRGETYETISQLTISEDGKTLAYAGGRKGELFVVVNETAQGPWANLAWPLRMSHDGSTIVYCAQRENQWFFVRNGQAGEPYEEASSPVLSSDGKIAACRARQQGRDLLIVNGNVTANHERINPRLIVRSDGIVAYCAKEGDTWEFMAGKSRLRVEGIPTSMVLSSTGTLRAYTEFLGNRNRLVIEGLEVRGVDDALGVFTDGQALAFLVGDPSSRALLFDGNRGGTFDEIKTPVFSPDGRHVAYWAYKDGGVWMVTDSCKSQAYDGEENPLRCLSGPWWDAAGRQVEYGVRIGDEFWWKTLKVD